MANNNNKDTRKRVTVNSEDCPSLNITYDNAEASTSSELRTGGNDTVGNRKRKYKKSRRCTACRKEMKAEKKKVMDHTSSNDTIITSADMFTYKFASENDHVISRFNDFVSARLEGNTDSIAANQIAMYLKMFLVKIPDKSNTK